MALSGLSGIGYSDITLTRRVEMLLSVAVSCAAILMSAFVLGTLFQYLMRTDENTVTFKALIKVRHRTAPRACAVRAAPLAQRLPDCVGLSQRYCAMPSH